MTWSVHHALAMFRFVQVYYNITKGKLQRAGRDSTLVPDAEPSSPATQSCLVLLSRLTGQTRQSSTEFGTFPSW